MLNEGWKSGEWINECMRIGLCHLCQSGERQDHLFGPVCFLTQHLSALCSQIPWGFWVRVDSSSEVGRTHINSGLSMAPSQGSRLPPRPKPAKAAQPG